MTVALRRATPADVPYLVGLIAHEDVRPFLAEEWTGRHAGSDNAGDG